MPANGIDANLIKEIWPYLYYGANVPDDAKLKDQAACYEIGLELRSELESALSKNNDTINDIMKKFPNAAGPSDQPAFELSDIGKDGIDIVKDIQIEYDDWTETSLESVWTIRTLKLWFFLIKGFPQANTWAQWPMIYNDKAFMDKACLVIKEEIEELHVYLISMSAQFEFENLEHMARMECLVKHLGGFAQVDPSAEDADSSVSTFVMFVLRDALEYAGLLPDKKRVPHRELKLCNFKKDMFQQTLSKLNNALD